MCEFPSRHVLLLTLQSSFVKMPDRGTLARFFERESFALIAKLRTFAEQLSVGSMVSHLSDTNWPHSSRFGCLFPHVSSSVKAIASRRRYTITTLLFAKVNIPVVAVFRLLYAYSFWFVLADVSSRSLCGNDVCVMPTMPASEPQKLTAFGLASYKLRGAVWLPNPEKRQELQELQKAAYDHLKRNGVHHPDFTFFMNHATPNRR